MFPEPLVLLFWLSMPAPSSGENRPRNLFKGMLYVIYVLRVTRYLRGCILECGQKRNVTRLEPEHNMHAPWYVPISLSLVVMPFVFGLFRLQFFNGWLSFRSFQLCKTDAIIGSYLASPHARITPLKGKPCIPYQWHPWTHVKQ